MDFATLKARIEAGRLTTAPLEGASFRLKVPTDHAWRVALQASMDGDGRVQDAIACRAVVEPAILGWEGVTSAHFGIEIEDGGEAGAVAFSEASRAELLEHRGDLAQQLFLEIARHRAARRERHEAAKKN
jgi:hypothetical protein